MQSEWKYMDGAPRPVNPNKNPPQTKMITGNLKIRMDDIRIRDRKSNLNVHKQRILSIALLGEPCFFPFEASASSQSHSSLLIALYDYLF